jgi:hypothetical protein
MPWRYVILQHVGKGPDHYDLMLQAGDSLATWQFGQNPADIPTGDPHACQRIQNHRQGYLNYEGPVSDNRGTVTRVDAGVYDTLHADQGFWKVALHSPAGDRIVEFRQLDSCEWRYRRLK